MSVVRWVNENKAHTQIPSKHHEGFLKETKMFDLFDFTKSHKCFQVQSLVVSLPGWDSVCTFDTLEEAKGYCELTLK